MAVQMSVGTMLKRFKKSRTPRRFLIALAAAAMLSAPDHHAFAQDHHMNVLAHASSGPLRCEIRRSDAGGAVELTGFLLGTRAVAGNFRFSVMKSGPSGSSNINQANKFDIAADKDSQIASVTINLESAGHVVVELFAGAGDGIECLAKASL
jgi:hypothetical protein